MYGSQNQRDFISFTVAEDGKYDNQKVRRRQSCWRNIMPKYQAALREEKAMRFLLLSREKKLHGRMGSNRCVFLSDLTISFSTCVKSLVIYSSFLQVTQVSMLEDVTEKLADVQAIRDSHDKHKEHDMSKKPKSQTQSHEKHKNQCHEMPNSQSYKMPENQSHKMPESQHFEKPECRSHEKPESESHDKPECQRHDKPECRSHEKRECRSHEKPESQSHEKSESQSQRYEKHKNQSHEQLKNQRYEQAKRQGHEKGKTQCYEKPNSQSYEKGKSQHKSHEKCENAYKCAKCISCKKSHKNMHVVQQKRQEKSHKKCKRRDKSDNKQRQKCTCKIHSIVLQNHKNPSSQNSYKKESHGDNHCFEKRTDKHVDGRYMKKMKVLFVVPVKQKCPRSLKRKVIETCKSGQKRHRKNRKTQTSGYTVPKHTRLTKKAKKKMLYNYRKNGKSVEARMKKEDKHTHEELKKTIFGHTRRTISKIIHAEQNVRAKKFRSKMNGPKISKVDNKRKTCEIKGDKLKELQQEADNGNTSRCTCMCWLCDKIDESGTRKIQCDKCCVWFHITCTGFLNMKQHLLRNTFIWVCRKCGHSNYCDTLFHNFGISTGENTIDLLFSGVDQCFTDGHVEELSAKKNATTHDTSMAGDRSIHGSQVQEGTSILIRAISWHGVYRTD